MSSRRQSSFPMVAASVLSALALLMLYGACVAPTGKWGLTAAAALVPLAVVASLGIRTGLLCWGGVSFLALLILPDRLCALLFAILFGLYPIVKALAERFRQLVLRYAVKLLFFNAALTVLLFVLGTLLLGSLPLVLGKNMWLLYGAGNVIFLFYDFGLTKLVQFYLIRVDRAVRRNRRVL